MGIRMNSRIGSVVRLIRITRLAFGMLALSAAVGHSGMSPALGGESPRLNDMLKVLGYTDLDAAKPGDRLGDPAFCVKSTSALPIQLLSASMRISPKQGRKPDDPWIRHGFEVLRGDGAAGQPSGKLILRFDYVIFDGAMNKVDASRFGVEMIPPKGERATTELSHGFQLPSPMKSGTDACLVLGRENEHKPWHVVSFSTFSLDRIE